MTSRLFMLAATMGFGIFTSPLLAHHSIAASHDPSRLVTITGTVTRVEWRNPHTWITLSVKKTSGEAVVQRVEIAGPGRLSRVGFNPGDLKVGDAVTIEAWLPKDDPRFRGLAPNGRTLILSDARRVDVGDNWSTR